MSGESTGTTLNGRIETLAESFQWHKKEGELNHTKLVVLLLAPLVKNLLLREACLLLNGFLVHFLKLLPLYPTKE